MASILEYLKHLFATTPVDVSIVCPVVDGQQDPQGFIAQSYVNTAWSLTFWLSLLAVLGLVFACYHLTRMTTGPGFSRRWTIFLPITAVTTALVALIVLKSMRFMAAELTCDTAPDPFKVGLPANVVWMRVFAGMIWGALAFVVFSVIFTKTLGRVRWNTGFFHNRGTPLPRFLPTGRNR
jgi:hypothetical protein